MLVGKCMRCGKQYLGWALSKTEYQTCTNCGARLVIRKMSTNYEPDNNTPSAPLGTGKEEWQESLENTLPQFLL